MALGFGDGVKKKEKMQRSLGVLKLLYASLEKYLIALLLLLASMVAYGFMNFEKLNDWYFVCFVLGIDAICVLWVFIYYKQTQVWEAINIVETVLWDNMTQAGYLNSLANLWRTIAGADVHADASQS